MPSVNRLPLAFRVAVLGFAFHCASAGVLSAQTTEVIVGGSAIRLPSPPGFHEVSGLSPETRRVAEAMTLPGNRLLAIFVSEADLGRLMAGDPAELERYMMVQTPRDERPFSASEFSDLARVVKERHETAVQRSAERVNPQMDRAESALSREHNVTVDLKIGEQRSLGIFTESDRTVGFATLGRVHVGGEDRSYVIAGATSMARVGSQVLFVYVYSNYSSPQDTDWVRATSTQWLGLIQAANHSSTAAPADSTPAGGFREWAFSSAFDPTTVGLVAAAALGAARLVQKRRKRSA